MFKAVSSFLGRVPGGLMAKDHSVGTGLLLALTVWTLTRLVDGVTQNGTIEYQSRYTQVSGSDGRPTSQVSVMLKNLSRDVSVTDLEVSIEDPNNRIAFDNTQPGHCAFGVPAWANGARCSPEKNGMSFQAPMLIPGTFVEVAIRYTGPISGDKRPIFRIKANSDSKIRLIEPGWETWFVEHENKVLFGLLGVTFVLLVVSIGAKISKDAMP